MADSPRESRPAALLWCLLGTLALLLVAVGVECAGLLYFAVTRGGFFYTASLAPDAEEPSAAVGNTVIHPYQAFSIRPGTRVLRFDDPAAGPAFLRGAPDPARPPEWVAIHSNNFGFYDEHDYPVRDPDAFLVGIFGGSFAHSLALQSGERLAARLEADPALAGRRVEVLNFASGGYKQPQQLLILSYFLVLGQRLDYVVNVDGFNEAVIGSANLEQGVDSSMPGVQFMRALRAQVSALRDPDALRYLVAVEELGAQRRALAKARSRARLASRYLWLDLRLRRVTARRQALAAEPPTVRPESSPIWMAPALEDPGVENGDKIAAEWFRASTLMAALAAAAGARYLHVLQPNQYAGGRHFSEEERRIAVNPRASYGPVVKALYPRLRHWGAGLPAAGVDYLDATGVFDDEPRIVYADDCCHLNQRGTDLFADHVADRIAAALGTRGG